MYSSLFMSSALCWGVPLSAQLVVVMGTQYYDGRGNAHTDYHVTDLLQMTGDASRPLLDNSRKCVILCHAPRDSLEIQITTTQRHLSDHLSELVESTLNDLEASKCITIEDDMDLSPSLGKIASYIYISYTTIEHFGSSLTSKTKMKVLLEILASASEHANLLIRNGEEEVLRRLINHQRLLRAMEMSQMVTLEMWEQDSMLLQLPHFTKELAKRYQERPGKNIQTIFYLVEMRDDERHALLDIAKFYNRFPNIDLSYEVIDSDNVRTGENVTLQITLDNETQVEPVDAPRYPKAKDEGWWLVIGETISNQLVAIKRVSIQRKANVKLELAAPTEAAEKTYTLYSMCDSYLGCD
ncbi:hypothetical protein J1N35_039975 [Gossypium stocksii]|uniref:SEC63 domain-containing protein n=1 Tax=Gossypium stocksii TaxID=47602 RepID=A0A9D3ZHW2_9ROSI|nr:hypothetical protein J1N35_039975 [Gossypium stocksii]